MDGDGLLGGGKRLLAPAERVEPDTVIVRMARAFREAGFVPLCSIRPGKDAANVGGKRGAGKGRVGERDQCCGEAAAGGVGRDPLQMGLEADDRQGVEGAADLDEGPAGGFGVGGDGGIEEGRSCRTAQGEAGEHRGGGGVPLGLARGEDERQDGRMVPQFPGNELLAQKVGAKGAGGPAVGVEAGDETGQQVQLDGGLAPGQRQRCEGRGRVDEAVDQRAVEYRLDEQPALPLGGQPDTAERFFPGPAFAPERPVEKIVRGRNGFARRRRERGDVDVEWDAVAIG